MSPVPSVAWEGKTWQALLGGSALVVPAAVAAEVASVSGKIAFVAGISGLLCYSSYALLVSDFSYWEGSSLQMQKGQLIGRPIIVTQTAGLSIGRYTGS